MRHYKKIYLVNWYPLHQSINQFVHQRTNHFVLTYFYSVNKDEYGTQQYWDICHNVGSEMSVFGLENVSGGICFWREEVKEVVIMEGVTLPRTTNKLYVLRK